MQKFRKKENVVRKPFIVCFGAHSGLTAEVFCDTITCKQRKEVEKIMHRFIQTFVKIFVLATALCVLSGCTPANLSSAKDDPDTTVITARRKNAQTELTETLADEKDKLPFFTGSTERTAESTASEAPTVTDAAARAETSDTATAETSAAAVQPTSTGYVCNTNSKKFHLSSCGSVKTISDKNRENYNGPRDDLIAGGYSPCKKGNP